MKTLFGIAVLALALASTALASATLTYKTDAQTERFVETGLRTWAGINLARRPNSAFCINGYYSRFEKRTGKHYPQKEYTNPKTGEYVVRFHSFACDLTLGSKTFKLYLLALPLNHWKVLVDR
jgi:hypothetical protein